jgi:hypothetical protein
MRHWLSNLLRYVPALIRWVAPPRVALLPLFVIVLAGLFFWMPFPLERKLRLSGMILQLGGVLLTGIDLHQKGTVFEDIPTLWQRAKKWWEGRPRFWPRTINLDIHSSGRTSVSSKAQVIRGITPDASLEERVRILETRCEDLRREITEVETDLGRKLSALGTEVTNVRVNQADALERTRQQLRRSVAEGIPLGWIGVFLFLFGILLATASPEIACLVSADCPLQ